MFAKADLLENGLHIIDHSLKSLGFINFCKHAYVKESCFVTLLNYS